MNGLWCCGTIPFWQLYSPRFTSSCHRLHELCLIICALVQFRDVIFTETDVNTLPETQTLILFPYHKFAFDTTESAKALRKQNCILDFLCKLFLLCFGDISSLTPPCQINHFPFLVWSVEVLFFDVSGVKLALLRYLSPCLVVVQVHQPAGVFLNLTGIYKAPRELHAILNIGRAASPLPALLLIVVVALLLPVAAALAEVALAARCSDCVGNSGCSDGIGECCLPASYRGKKEDNLKKSGK